MPIGGILDFANAKEKTTYFSVHQTDFHMWAVLGNLWVEGSVSYV